VADSRTSALQLTAEEMRDAGYRIAQSRLHRP